MDEKETKEAFAGPAALINRFSVTVRGDQVRIGFLEQCPAEKNHFRAAVAMSRADAKELSELLSQLLSAS